jgi:hypothetical protein
VRAPAPKLLASGPQERGGTVLAMTTNTRVRVPAPRTADHDALPHRRPRRAARALTDPALAARALRSGTRLAADALTGIALDDPCCAARQRDLVRWTAGVLAEVRGHAGPLHPGRHEALDTALTLAERGLALFGREVSAGAPVLAPVLADLADLVEARLDAGPLPPAPRRTAGQSLFALPWLLDACHPAELTAVLATASRAERLALRLGARRYASARDAALGRAR